MHLERKHNMVVQMEDLEEMRKFHIVRSKLVMAKIYSDQKESHHAKNDSAAISK